MMDGCLVDLKKRSLLNESSDVNLLMLRTKFTPGFLHHKSIVIPYKVRRILF